MQMNDKMKKVLEDLLIAIEANSTSPHNRRELFMHELFSPLLYLMKSGFRDHLRSLCSKYNVQMEIPVFHVKIDGARYFSKKFGSTYFSSRIMVDGEIVEGIINSYGGSDHYLHASWNKLEKEGIVPTCTDDFHSPWRKSESLGIILEYSVRDVSYREMKSFSF